eukprot:COSAG01_NODE_12035_length_1810_cov_9.682057_2_plen_77_part_00
MTLVLLVSQTDGFLQAGAGMGSLGFCPKPAVKLCMAEGLRRLTVDVNIRRKWLTTDDMHDNILGYCTTRVQLYAVL